MTKALINENNNLKSTVHIENLLNSFSFFIKLTAGDYSMI